MGNSIGGLILKKKRAVVMTIDGQTFKVNPPATAADVLRDYSSAHVLLESEQVKKHGIRAQHLRPEQGLKPGKIYFLVEMPKFPEARTTRRAKSLPHTSSAIERLEGLMLRQKSAVYVGPDSGSGPVRVKMTLPLAEIEKFMRESNDEAEVGQRVLEFCLQNKPV
ncbi:uncharacterized protein At1g66480-like [Salvia splendens]|uniref:uncharacterized protein At1g66480-like n=1 Tax=Salvia splendens TaxID=180675 RepID=UPI0011045970|nr:uncharacterized protein At1g66480-like [Salvia splendens]